jgi:hypothetical protein
MAAGSSQFLTDLSLAKDISSLSHGPSLGQLMPWQMTSLKVFKGKIERAKAGEQNRGHNLFFM